MTRNPTYYIYGQPLNVSFQMLNFIKNVYFSKATKVIYLSFLSNHNVSKLVLLVLTCRNES